ncbi:hypothetical protein GCM10028796_07230 [Ramlibacter monticola]
MLERNIMKGTLMRHGDAPLPRQHRAVTLGILLLGLLSLLPPAWAGVDRDQAASIAHHLAPGRVLAVEQGLHVDNTVVWRIKVLSTAGDVRLIVIDAETGRSR